LSTGVVKDPPTSQVRMVVCELPLLIINLLIIVEGLVPEKDALPAPLNVKSPIISVPAQ